MWSAVSAHLPVDDGCCSDAQRYLQIQLLYLYSHEASNNAAITFTDSSFNSIIARMHVHVSTHVLIALLLASSATAVHGQQQQQVLDLLSVQQEAVQMPLRAVGQLSNGCTGYLIGPCHVSAAGCAASTQVTPFSGLLLVLMSCCGCKHCIAEAACIGWHLQPPTVPIPMHARPTRALCFK
jgi:hypothetical protein